MFEVLICYYKVLEVISILEMGIYIFCAMAPSGLLN